MTRTPSPDCRAFLEHLSRYVDDELPPREERTFVRHLGRCPCCHDLVESLERTVSLCHAAGRRRLPPDVRSRARARIARLLAEPEPVRLAKR